MFWGNIVCACEIALVTVNNVIVICQQKLEYISSEYYCFSIQILPSVSITVSINHCIRVNTL